LDGFLNIVDGRGFICATSRLGNSGAYNTNFVVETEEVKVSDAGDFITPKTAKEKLMFSLVVATSLCES